MVIHRRGFEFIQKRFDLTMRVYGVVCLVACGLFLLEERLDRDANLLNRLSRRSNWRFSSCSVTTDDVPARSVVVRTRGDIR